MDICVCQGLQIFLRLYKTVEITKKKLRLERDKNKKKNKDAKGSIKQPEIRKIHRVCDTERESKKSHALIR